MRTCGGEICPIQKMTKDIHLSTMTNRKEILPQYRDQLETEIKDIILTIFRQSDRMLSQR